MNRDLRWHAGVTLRAVLAIQLAGCAQALAPLPAAPVIPLPAHFDRAAAAGMPGPDRSEDAAASRAALASWWEQMGNAELNRLVDRAIANNPDLRIANLQVQEAALRRDSAKAGRLPEITAPVSRAAQFPGGQIPGVPSAGGGGMQLSLQAQLAATWHPDVWGEFAATERSAEWQLLRAVHQREDTERLLVGVVVSAYISYLAANDTLRTTQDQVRIAEDMLRTTQQALDAHDAVLEDVERSRAALANLQATLPMLQMQREEAQSTLAFLAGALPGDLPLTPEGMDSVTLPNADLPLNTRLLLERPDIRMVEARLQGAQADIAVARARLLPPVTFSSASGFTGQALQHLLQSQFFFWNAIATITPVIFDGGRRAKEDAGNRASFEEMVSTYLRTILQAAREVEDALGNVRANRERLTSQSVAEQSTRRILGLNQQAYRLGAVSTATLLEAQRVWQQADAERLRLRGEYLKAHVALYQALGVPTLRQSDQDPTGLPLAIDAAQFGERLKGGPVRTPWSVDLPGVYPASALPAVWRDLRRRFPQHPAGLGLEAEAAGSLEGAQDSNARWYRLRLVQFPARADADAFCGALREAQQLCSTTQRMVRS